MSGYLDICSGGLIIQKLKGRVYCGDIYRQIKQERWPTSLEAVATHLYVDMNFRSEGKRAVEAATDPFFPQATKISSIPSASSIFSDKRSPPVLKSHERASRYPTGSFTRRSPNFL